MNEYIIYIIGVQTRIHFLLGNYNVGIIFICNMKIHGVFLIVV
jgi:hypothetical protein